MQFGKVPFDDGEQLILGGGAESWGGNFMLTFSAAVAFAYTIAVVVGLTLAAASALAHDINVGVICHGITTEHLFAPSR